MIQEITTFIAQKSADPTWSITQTWTLGTNLFAGTIPVKNVLGNDIPKRFLAVLENAGGSLLANVGGVVKAAPPSAPGDITYFPKYAEKAIQLWNRAEDYMTAHDDAEELFEAFDQTAGWELPLVPAPGGQNRRYIVIVIDAYGPPAPIENPGITGFYTFSTNYTWKIEEASC